MADVNLMPIAGINNVGTDEELQVRGKEPSLHLRDAVNVDVSAAYRPSMRAGVRKVSSTPLANLWHSPLHADSFATLGSDWVRVNPADWSTEVLAHIGEGDVSHLVLINQVLVAGAAGILEFNGAAAQPLTIQTPPMPLVVGDAGSLAPGTYGVAVSWLRGAKESALSEMVSVDVTGGLSITFPMVMDPGVTAVRLYLSKPGSGELQRAGDYPAGQASVLVPLLPELGAAAQFRHLSPMPTGRFLSYWRGRVLTAWRNLVRFSEAMAYHLHDERHGFVQMPQRVTFLAPVDGGIYVGQVDHVAFLRGSDLGGLEMVRLHSRAPVPGSLVYLDTDLAGELSQGGAATLLWLADNGYVTGTSQGAIVENTAGKLQGIVAQHGASAVLGDRVVTLLK